ACDRSRRRWYDRRNLRYGKPWYRGPQGALAEAGARNLLIQQDNEDMESFLGMRAIGKHAGLVLDVLTGQSVCEEGCKGKEGKEVARRHGAPLIRFRRCGTLRPSNPRPALRMKRLHRLQPPAVAFLASFLGPHDRLPVRRENQAGAGVGDFDAVAAGLPDVEEEG